jgi:type IV pilus assembly protein PilM
MILSIDIGTRNLHIVEGKVNGRTVDIVRAAVEPISQGAIADGIIKDHAGLEVALRSALARRGFTGGNTVLTTNGSHAFVKELEVPILKPKETTSVINFEVLQSVGSGKDMVVEYVKIGESTTPEGGRVARIRAMALQKDVVADYYQMLRNTKLTPLAMDIHQNAIVKLFSGGTINGRPIEGRSILLVDIGAASTCVYILTNGELVYNRLLPLGSIDFERYSLQKKIAAESEGKTYSPDLDLTLENVRADPLLADAVRPFFNTLSDSIQRIVQYHKGRVENFIVDDIFLFGGAASYQGFSETLGSILTLEVQTIQKMDRIHAPADIRIADYINACGAMIRLE